MVRGSAHKKHFVEGMVGPSSDHADTQSPASIRRNKEPHTYDTIVRPAEISLVSESHMSKYVSGRR